MKATGYKNFLTSIFALTALFAVLPTTESHAASIPGFDSFISGAPNSLQEMQAFREQAFADFDKTKEQNFKDYETRSAQILSDYKNSSADMFKTGNEEKNKKLEEIRSYCNGTDLRLECSRSGGRLIASVGCDFKSETDKEKALAATSEWCKMPDNLSTDANKGQLDSLKNIGSTAAIHAVADGRTNGAAQPTTTQTPDNTSQDSTQKQNLGQKIAGGAKNVAGAVGNVAKKGANAIGNLFKGSEPCTDEQITELKKSAQNQDKIEKTKLDKDSKCIVSKCVKNFVPNDAKSGCEQSGGECKPNAENATAGELKKGNCIVTECGNGWHPSDDGTKCERAELSEEDSKAKVDELRDNAQKMKDKEQSTANKMLGAAAIGTTGIGAMNMMSGLAEQNADDSAEEDMRAYLATFVCDYGQGRNIKGGERDIDLPGGNELFNQVNEYKALAADLKIRKEALGKTPGIESEIIYDAAETGLYDNVGMGRQSGAYASLSRALMDENSEDAARWNEQKQAAHDKKNTGLKTAAAGAIGGLVGNLAINSGDKNKNQSDKIINDYKKKKQIIQEIQETIATTPEQPDTQCSDYTYNGQKLSGQYPYCNCGNEAYFNASHTEGCVSCIGATIPNKEKTACVCPNGRTPDVNGTCPSTTAPCSLTGDFVNSTNGACECIKPAVPNADNTACICNTATNDYNDNGTCKHCDTNTHTLTNGQCNENVIETALTPIIIKESRFFDKSSAYINNLDTLDRTLIKIQEVLDDSSNICIEGQTDPSQFPKNSRKNNQDLSTARAYSLMRIMNKNIVGAIYYKGTGEVRNKDTAEQIPDPKDRCDPDDKSTYGNCRRVLITVTTNDCGEGFTTSTEEPKNYNLYIK